MVSLPAFSSSLASCKADDNRCNDLTCRINCSSRLWASVTLGTCSGRPSPCSDKYTCTVMQTTIDAMISHVELIVPVVSGLLLLWVPVPEDPHPVVINIHVELNSFYHMMWHLGVK